MPGIVWERLVSVTMSRLGIDLIREELARQQLDTAGFKEEHIQRLEADIRQQREASPRLKRMLPSSAAAPLTLDPALPDTVPKTACNMIRCLCQSSRHGKC